MTYFTIAEFTRSQTATKLGIRNDPPATVRHNLTILTNLLLDPLREAWGVECAAHQLGGAGLRITSGYRSPQLNAAVGGSSTSAHLAGLAADIVPLNGQMEAFCRFAHDFLTTRSFDQLIFEQTDNRGIPQWIHISLQTPSGTQRCEMLAMKDGKYTRL